MRAWFLGALILGASAVTAGAFSFEPISRDFAPSGREAGHVFRVANTTAERIAVRVTVRPRRIEPDGTEVQGDESGDFVVYPRQMLLAPGEQRSVRVRWTGPAELESERAFRIIAEQLPVEMGEERPQQGGGIRLTYRYEGSLYVVPPGARPDVALQSVERVTVNGVVMLRLEIRNAGTRHALLGNLQVMLRQADRGEPRRTLRGDELGGVIGENMPAQSTRLFLVPLPPDLWDGPLYGDLTYTAQ